MQRNSDTEFNISDDCCFCNGARFYHLTKNKKIKYLIEINFNLLLHFSQVLFVEFQNINVIILFFYYNSTLDLILTWQFYYIIFTSFSDQCDELLSRLTRCWLLTSTFIITNVLKSIIYFIFNKYEIFLNAKLGFRSVSIILMRVINFDLLFQVIIFLLRFKG